MKLVHMCEVCGNYTMSENFIGIHCCPNHPTVPLLICNVITQRTVQKTGFVIVDRLGCSRHDRCSVSAFYDLESYISECNDCTECLQTLFTLIKPDKSWIFAIHESLHQWFMDFIMPEDEDAENMWECFTERRQFADRERKVFRYLRSNYEWEPDGYFFESIAILNDVEYLACINEEAKCKWLDTNVAPFYTACLSGHTAMVRWLIENQGPIVFDLSSYCIEDGVITSDNGFKTAISPTLDCFDITSPKSLIIHVYLSKTTKKDMDDILQILENLYPEHASGSISWHPNPKDMIVSCPEITYEFFTDYDTLKLAGIKYTGWRNIKINKDNLRTYIIPWVAANLTVYYGDYTENYNTCIVVKRNDDIISSYREPGCSLQIGDADMAAVCCQVETDHYLLIENWGDVSSRVLMRFKSQVSSL